jgi:tetratricopeptide (TPR) repeat protein
MAPPISIKLRCNSWKQLAALYKRDLARSAVFLKSSAPPPLETPVRIHLTLPNRELVVLDGVVYQHVPPGGLNGRGPGVDIKLPEIPAPVMAKIQAALENPDKDDGTGKASSARADEAGAEDGDGQESGAPASAEQAGQQQQADQAADTAHAGAAAHGSPNDDGGDDGDEQRTAAPPPDNPLGSLLDDDILGDLVPPADAGAAQAPPTSPEEDMAAIHEAAERVARLEQERESLRKLNAFQILGVGYETTDEAVHEAFASLSQRYHPDSFAGEENEPARDIAVEIFALIRAAHRLLENGSSRERLRRELKRAERGADGASSAADSGSAPAHPQEEIPTKPVMVAEDGTRVIEPGAPAGPQDEMPTKPAVVSENSSGEQAAARPATPPPIPKSRAATPPPIPKSRAATPPPIPRREPPKQDEDVIAVDDIGIEEMESAPAIAIPEAVATPPAAAAETALDDELGTALRAFDDGPVASDAGAVVAAVPDDVTPLPAEQDESAAPAEQDAAAEAPAAAPEPTPTPEATPAPDASESVIETAAQAADRAAEQAAQAVAADPSALGMASAPQFAEAIALLAAGKYTEAATVYRVARRRDPDDVAARVGLELCEGLKALANRDKLEAAQRFEAALELDPDNRRAASELAEMRRQAAKQRKDNLIRLRDQID